MREIYTRQARLLLSVLKCLEYERPDGAPFFALKGGTALNFFVHHVAEKNACSDTVLLKAFMAEYVQQDVRQQQYAAWFIRKVEAGLHELQEGKVLSHEEANS